MPQWVNLSWFLLPRTLISGVCMSHQNKQDPAPILDQRNFFLSNEVLKHISNLSMNIPCIVQVVIRSISIWNSITRRHSWVSLCTLYCTLYNKDKDGCKDYTRWTHKADPISHYYKRAMGRILWVFWLTMTVLTRKTLLPYDKQQRLFQCTDVVLIV